MKTVSPETLSPHPHFTECLTCGAAVANLSVHHQWHNQLENPPAPAGVFILRKPDDETLVVLLNGVEVGSANHDEDGWAGMRSLEELVKAIAVVLKFSVETDSGDEETEEDE